MASKLNPWGVCRSLSIRPRPWLRTVERNAPVALPAARRGLSSDTHSSEPPSNGGSSIPPSNPGAPPPYEHFAPTFLNAEAVAQLERVAAGEELYDETVGLKFDKPTPPGKKDRLQNRYPEVIDQVTKLMMRDGKLSKAQRDMGYVLNFLRTSPSPKTPLKPLLPGAPPPHHLPLDPVLYLTLAIDSVAPLLRVRAMKGMGGGGTSLDVPEPLAARQRRRIAIKWILDTVDKKKSKGSGRTMFAHRLAEEIIAVIEGRSSVWEKRQQVHKLGTVSRANLNHPGMIAKRSK